MESSSKIVVNKPKLMFASKAVLIRIAGATYNLRDHSVSELRWMKNHEDCGENSAKAIDLELTRRKSIESIWENL